MDEARARAELARKREEIEAGLAEITAVPRDPAAAVSFGKRVGDGTTEAVERLNKVAAADGLAATLREVERALAKLDEGSYGVCDRCGATVAPERLEVRPWSVRCVRCAAEAGPV